MRYARPYRLSNRLSDQIDIMDYIQRTRQDHATPRPFMLSSLHVYLHASFVCA
jgi:hypothetical protein